MSGVLQRLKRGAVASLLICGGIGAMIQFHAVPKADMAWKHLTDPTLRPRAVEQGYHSEWKEEELEVDRQLRLVRQIEMLPISETEKAVRKSELARSVHLPTFDFPDGSKRIGENIVGKCQ